MRTPLFVPANRPDRFQKAASSGADAIILDLEDAVPADAKADARKNLRSDFTELPVLVRINGTGTSWHYADVSAVLAGRFSGLVVPKAEPINAFESLCKTAAESNLPVIALVETALGVAEVRAIAAIQGVKRVAFGSIDYAAELGLSHSKLALLSARSEIVLASRLASLAAAIDGVTTSIENMGLVADDARHALELGFGGKFCIHPRQIEPIRQAFIPSDLEIEWARQVLNSVQGVVAVNGEMIDAPVRARAQALLARAADVPGFVGASLGNQLPGSIRDKSIDRHSS
jgi:citrate lyase subunit beta / citryl-CoA lyase